MTVDIYFKGRRIPVSETCDNFSLTDDARIVRLYTKKQVGSGSALMNLTAVFNFDIISDIHINYE